MKKYKVTVNGNCYEVEIELLSENETVAAKAPAAPAASVGNSASETVTSPMPGTILQVNVRPGQKVKKGDVLFILEAMKMENEIMASVDGTIAAVSVDKGAAVESGALLCTFN